MPAAISRMDQVCQRDEGQQLLMRMRINAIVIGGA